MHKPLCSDEACIFIIYGDIIYIYIIFKSYPCRELTNISVKLDEMVKGMKQQHGLGMHRLGKRAPSCCLGPNLEPPGVI